MTEYRHDLHQRDALLAGLSTHAAARAGNQPAAHPYQFRQQRSSALAAGKTSREIAEMLNLSVKTVQPHRNNLMQQLDLHDRGELIKYAVQKKIIEL